MEQILEKYALLNQFNVSRETCLDFEKFISMIEEKNKKINIISKETAKNDVIRNRHIIDSAQAVDFIDFRGTLPTLGSGRSLGFSGVISMTLSCSSWAIRARLSARFIVTY